ncbi:MAG: hypothetical protein ACLUEQ_01055 [Cloacibacillus evryensis]
MAIPQNIKDEMRARRRDFHKYPESGWAEFRTTAIAAEILEKIGWKVRFAKDFIDPDEVTVITSFPKGADARHFAGADKKTLAKIGAPDSRPRSTPAERAPSQSSGST